MSRKLVRNILFYVMTLALVLTAALLVTFTAHSKERMDEKEEERYYRGLEREFVSDVGEFLNGIGCVNSGVTLTRVVDREGNRAYTVTVHHRKIDRMEQVEREELAGQMEALSFAAEGCTFEYHFLLAE